MKHVMILSMLLCLLHPCCIAQQIPAKKTAGKGSQFAVKAGYNIARLTGKSIQFKPTPANGFMAGLSYAAPAKKGFGFRTELVFSRQGFDFTDAGVDHSVVSDYLYLPQFTTFGIGRFIQLQLGAQAGYLLRSGREGQAGKTNISALMNRFDYGASGGLEIYPFKGIIAGGRYNMSFGNSFKASGGTVVSPLPFDPSDVKNRNAVINIYLGYKF